MKHYSIYCCFLFGCASAAPDTSFDVPLPVKNKHTLEVGCVGYGVSIDHARADAIESCQKSAAAYLGKDITVKGESWETGNSAYSATQIASTAQINNLDCIPLSEKSKISADTAKVFLLCRFNLAKVTIETNKNNDTKTEEQDTSIRSDSTGRLIVASVPPCQKVTIVGDQNITHTCSGNPAQFVFSNKDRKVIIEREGFLPKIVELKFDLITNVSVSLRPAD